ncbi:alpha-galactosidase [Kitasatospora sp. MAP12-15]|uniref:alpha-galactosidase n=1 Tax=unclassified Kitasatospora TaxID=2633591 RepID=UPI002473DDB8|nr:alpha-galactosidase [Kitasatospora sp. MAP12-44]MDH6109835.1 alpha-galactosidase [Kitasatospora sp. MAP12-44]
MRTFPSLVRTFVRPALALALVAAAAPAALLAAAPAQAQAQANGVALTPPMGWSSWSFLRKNPTEANIEAQAKAMSTTGLVAHGYKYVNIDDFWYLNPATTVDAYGRWATDPSHFPNGMGAVGSYVHNLGEKYGMYLTPGIPVAAYNQNTPIQGTSFHARDIVSNTLSYETNYNFGTGSMYYIDYAKNPAAAQAYLNSWADQLASYGVDYLKIDGVGDWDIPDIQHWSQALNQTGRPIHLELSNSLDIKNAPTWQQSANGWRIDGDVECYCSASSYPLTDWTNVAYRFGDAPDWAGYAGSGGWNDLDSVEVGNGGNDGLTPDERQSQLTLWSIEGAPLLLGTDLTSMDSGDLGLLTNDEVLAVDQAGHPARPVDRLTQQQVWSAPNGDGSYTVALFNLTGSAAPVTARWSDVGFSGSASVRDLWSHTELGSANGTFSATIPAHGSRLLKVTPTAGAHSTLLRYNVVNAASGQYLDVSGAATADDSPIVQQPADGGTDQQWQLVPTGDGYYKLENVNSGLLVNIPGGSSTSGLPLIQYHDDNAPNSQWKLTPNAGGGYTVAGRSDGQSMDLAGGATAAGTAVVQSAPGSSASQQWKLVPVPVPGAQYKLVNGRSGGRMDVNFDSTGDNAAIVEWFDNEASDQLWTFTAQSGGAYTIANANSGKLLNIPGPSTIQGTQLIQYHDDGNSNSRWTLVDAGPNLVQLKSVYDGQLVDLDNGSLYPGGSVLQWPADGGTNQTWSLVPPS